MNVMQQPAPFLPYRTVPEPRALIVGLFWSSLIWQEDTAKIPKVPGAPRIVNPARE